MATNKLIIAIFAGAAAGFVLGVLMTPEKGADVRKKIGDTVANLADRLVDLFSTEQQNLLQPAAGESLVNPNEILG